MDDDNTTLESSYCLPDDSIKYKEFIDGMMKTGSFISQIEQKRLSNVALFVCVLENQLYQQIFVELTSAKSFRDAISTLLYIHPSLVKSKFTKTAIRKINAARNSD